MAKSNENLMEVKNLKKYFLLRGGFLSRATGDVRQSRYAFSGAKSSSISSPVERRDASEGNDSYGFIL